LELEVKHLRAQLERERETVSDLRRRLDAEAEERRRLTLMLTDQRPRPETEKAAGRFWSPWLRWGRRKG
jgi:hypothetical protein